jgi:mannosyltransferase PIG-V
MAAVRDSWRALWRSRLLVWVAAIAAGVLRSSHAGAGAVDPRGLTRGLGRVGEVLAGPLARWDAGWFLLIARDGYSPQLGARTEARLAFYPLYPLLTRAAGLVVPLVIAGAVVSMCAFAAALYGIHRLTTLELGHRSAGASPERSERVAGLALLLIAFSPMAVFFSADYSESLFMALSVALFWCARNGRWAWVGVAGALASATRAPGLILAVPALAIYLYGPREDRPPERTAVARAARDGLAAGVGLSRALAALRPRYRIRGDVLWLALLPAGVAAYCAWIALAGGDALSPFKVEHQIWGRHLSDPLATVWYGVRTTFDEYRHLPAHGRLHLTTFYFLLAGLLATVGVLRRLPLAYGLYAIVAILLPLSYPGATGAGEPLESMPRYILVLFPLGIWLAIWLEEHPRLRRPTLVLSALAMVFYTANFATWRWAS